MGGDSFGLLIDFLLVFERRSALEADHFVQLGVR